MELDMTTVEQRRYEESEEFDMVKTDRNIAKKYEEYKVYTEYEEFEEHEYEFHTDKFEEYEDEKVPKWTNHGDDLRDDGDRAVHEVGQDSNPLEVPRPLLRGGCNKEQFKSFTQQWSLYASLRRVQW
jgi:hypothetical protein